jgi:hypothetical protein
VGLGSCNYLNICWGLFWGRSSHGSSSSPCSLVLLSSSLSRAISCALALSMEMNGRKRRAIVEWL